MQTALMHWCGLPLTVSYTAYMDDNNVGVGKRLYVELDCVEVDEHYFEIDGISYLGRSLEDWIVEKLYSGDY